MLLMTFKKKEIYITKKFLNRKSQEHPNLYGSKNILIVN